MSLILLNLQSNQEIKLDNQNPLIIGRKNVQGCFDKRVSRNHGRITCTDDGRIRLEALHCNPCFFTRNGVPPVLQLNKDEEETLSEGDYLGLLPNEFWFKITSNKKTEIKIEADNSDDTRTTQNCEENIRTSDLGESSNVTKNSEADETVIIKPEDKCEPELKTGILNTVPASVSDKEINSAGPSKGFGSAEFEKTRRLPLWMYEIDDLEGGSRHSNKRPAPSSSEKEKKQKMSPETDINTGSGTEVVAEKANINSPSTSKIKILNELPNSTSDLQSTVEGESSKEDSKKEGYESDVDHDRDDLARPICQYEGNCYRQNPQHKSQFCHPGDSDYVPYEQRPLCQYGASCYRRNEKHRVEFRHPPRGSDSHNVSSSCSRDSVASSPLPSKRKRKKIKMQNDYEDDEYDLEDPFINDASSDEYIPSDYEEEEEEEQEEDLSTFGDDD